MSSDYKFLGWKRIRKNFVLARSENERFFLRVSRGEKFLRRLSWQPRRLREGFVGLRHFSLRTFAGSVAPFQVGYRGFHVGVPEPLLQRSGADAAQHSYFRDQTPVGQLIWYA